MTNENDETDMIEYRKLRIENSLLRQRTDRLQEVTSILNETLSSLGVNLLQKEHESSKEDDDAPELLESGDLRELSELQRRYADVRKNLHEAYQTIDELTRTPEGKHDKQVQIDDNSSIEHIHILQEQAMEAKTRETDYVQVIKDLKNRAEELESANQKLRDESPTHSLPALQNELDELETREIESNRLLKETRRKIRELREEWEAFIARRPIQDLRGEIFGAIIREADSMSELKECSQRVMELETRNRVLANQIRRRDEEYKKLECLNDNWPGKRRELDCEIRETQHKVYDAEAQFKENAIMNRLKEAEIMETIADLKNRISEIESGFYEKWMQQQLDKDDQDDNDDDDDYSDNENDSFHDQQESSKKFSDIEMMPKNKTELTNQKAAEEERIEKERNRPKMEDRSLSIDLKKSINQAATSTTAGCSSSAAVTKNGSRLPSITNDVHVSAA